MQAALLIETLPGKHIPCHHEQRGVYDFDLPALPALPSLLIYEPLSSTSSISMQTAANGSPAKLQLRTLPCLLQRQSVCVPDISTLY